VAASFPPSRNNNPAAKARASRGQVARYYRRGGPTTCIWCFAIRPWLVSALTPCRSANICSNPPGVTPNTVAAGESEAFIVLPGEAQGYGGQQGREADVTELLATAEQTGGVLGVFRQTIAPKSGPPTHLHGMEAEFCYVVSGQFNFKLGERVVSANAAMPAIGTSFLSAPPPQRLKSSSQLTLRWREMDSKSQFRAR